MSKLRLNRYGLVLLGLSCTFVAIAAKSVKSQEIKPTNNSFKIAKISALSESDKISTQAVDLLSPIELPDYFTDVRARNYKLGQLDLRQFCQDFPHNSRCGGAAPEGSETNSIPVPVPPPEPPASSQKSSRRDGQKSGWAIVPEISTLGLGGHLVKKIIPQINARLGVNGFNLGLDGIDTDIDYEADLNLFNVSTIIDIHPLKSSGWRLSGGFIFGNNNFDGSADVSDLVIEGLEEADELNDDIIETLEDIQGLANVNADVEIASGVSPYLGIGGGNAVGEGKGFGFWWNLGVVFSGSPDIDLDTELASGQIRDTFAGTEFEAEVDQIINETEDSLEEVVDGEEDDIQDELNFVEIYPVISIGISYQF